MLERVATHYEAAVDDGVDNLTALLEPFIMSVLAVLVGGILIAMYPANFSNWVLWSKCWFEMLPKVPPCLP